MFHYVKTDFNYYHYDLNLFEETIKYLSKKFKIISLKEYDNFNKNKCEIKDKCVMLTFDDGTLDHYKNVYPILKKYGCSGLFFIPSSVFNKKVLDIQIIHQLLLKIDAKILLKELLIELKKNNINFENNCEENSEAVFKQLMQYKLKYEYRKKMLAYFINKYNISTCVEDYYMNIEQLKEMKKHNMFFGIHTDTHPRLDILTKDEQLKEIKNNKKYLLENNLIEKSIISIAYPFGKYNEETLDILKKEHIKYGFRIGGKESNNSLLINRIDCKNLSEEVNEKIYTNRK